MNGTLSFYECRFSDEDCHEVVRILKLYLMRKHLLELFALTGGGDTRMWDKALTPSLSPLPVPSPKR